MRKHPSFSGLVPGKRKRNKWPLSGGKKNVWAGISGEHGQWTYFFKTREKSQSFAAGMVRWEKKCLPHPFFVGLCRKLLSGTNPGNNFACANYDKSSICDVASFLESYSDKISLAGLGRLTGINCKQLSHYLTRKRNPSCKTVEKIEAALHNFGKEISQVHFI
jgi:hypothetical protein